MKLIALLANPAAHSKSPLMHKYAIKALGLDGIYLAMDINPPLLKEHLLDLSAANISYPFKKDILNYCTKIDEDVAAIAAANTIIRHEDGFHAHNTDWKGFLRSIKDENIKTALILGSGASSTAIAYAFLKANISYDIASRSKHKKGLINYDDISNFSYDLVVNATPSSLIGSQLPCKEQLLSKLFNEAKLAVDLSYTAYSPFLALASKKGVATKDGLYMLLWQGFYAFKLFFDIKDESKDSFIIDAMKRALKLAN